MVPHRHLIAYDAALVLLPATLLGTTVGVFLNKVYAFRAIRGRAFRAIRGRGFRAWGFGMHGS